MKYSIIFACSENGVIGKDNTIPWKINLDMKLFKKLTENNIVIMGLPSLAIRRACSAARCGSVITAPGSFLGASFPSEV